MSRVLGFCFTVMAFVCLTQASAGDGKGFPTGTFVAKFEGAEFAIRFDGKGKLLVTFDKKEFVTGTYKVTKDEIAFTDEGGPGASKENPGRYKWKFEGGKLTFKTIQDKAEGREKALSGTAWTLQKDAK